MAILIIQSDEWMDGSLHNMTPAFAMNTLPRTILPYFLQNVAIREKINDNLFFFS
jgi:hypothetical protein